MRQSELFTKTRKEAPSGEVATNAALLIRAGYIYKEMAGVYAFLPLGLRVFENLKSVVREEMNRIGGEEILMTTLQRKEVWEKTDRWDDEKVDVWFKSELHAGGEVGFGWSHEEPISEMMKNYITSYRDLPAYVYQFQTKLRNELRAKSGIMRGREFAMKDLYSYAKDESAHQAFYEAAIHAYHEVFKRVGIGDRTYLTFAPGGAFTDFSHEFQTTTEAGEDTVYVCDNCKVAVNEEIIDKQDTCPECDSKELRKAVAAEVGNIFDFGTDKSKQLGLFFKDENGNDVPVHLGSYGIGITRLMGVLVEIFADEKGIAWPKEIAPFRYHLVELPSDDPEVRATAERLYAGLTERGYEVLYDDRDAHAGEKFVDADLIGIPTRLVVSEKAKAKGGVEVKDRATGEVAITPEAELA